MSEFPDNWEEIAWNKLPVDIRRRAVERLKLAYQPSFFEQVRQRAEADGLGKWLPLFWHHGQGMEVRNMLRSNALLEEERSLRAIVRKLLGQSYPAPIRDSELPKLPELYGADVSTWDDYYVQCIEAAAGLRDIDADTP